MAIGKAIGGWLRAIIRETRRPVGISGGAVIVLGILLLLGRHFFSPAVPAVLAGVGFLLSFLWVRRFSDPFLKWAVLGGYFIRVLLAWMLYIVSAWQIPLFQSLQLGEGFWAFAPDSRYYHLHAMRIVEAWNQGTEIPEDLATNPWYFFVVAAAYKLFGAHPLNAIVMNAWLTSLTSVLAYLLARELSGTVAARTAAVLVGLWPSAILWSTQLLKEVPIALLIVSPLYLIILAVNKEGLPWSSILPVWGGLATLIFILSYGREFYSLTLIMAALPVFGGAIGHSLWSGYPKRALRFALLIMCLLGATFSARNPALVRLFSPASPHVGHFRLGVQEVERGNLEKGIAEYRRAIELENSYLPAYRGLIMALWQAERYEEAHAQLEAFTRHQGSTLEDRRWAQEVIVRLRGSAMRPLELGVAPEIKGTDVAVEATSTERLGSPPVERPSFLDPLSRKVAAVSSRLGREAVAVSTRAKTFFWLIGEFQPKIAGYREGQRSGPGHSPISPEADFSTTGKILLYLPKGLAYFFLAPFPWQWFDATGPTGILKAFSGIEMLLIYLLLPAMFLGAVSLMRRAGPAGIFLIAYSFVGAIVLALTMVNLGNLFRYRMPFFLLLVIAASGQVLPLYNWMSCPRSRYRLLYGSRDNRRDGMETASQERGSPSHRVESPFSRKSDLDVR